MYYEKRRGKNGPATATRVLALVTLSITCATLAATVCHLAFLKGRDKSPKGVYDAKRNRFHHN